MEAKKPKRNVMNSIRRRLNSNAYNTRNLKKNEQVIRKKLRDFDKKEELKGYMMTRYDAALDLLGRLEEIKEVGATEEPKPKKFTIKKRVKIPVEEIVPPQPKLQLNAVAGLPPMTLKKRRAKTIAAPVTGPPEFVMPPANLPPLPIPRGEYNREGAFQLKGFANAEPELQDEEVGANNAARFGYVPKSDEPKIPKQRKPQFYAFSRKELNPENLPYLERVHGQFLPLPELYNPYTGVKYGADEDPLKNIESAHLMLEEILEKAKKKALALKRKETRKKTQAKAAV